MPIIAPKWVKIGDDIFEVTETIEQKRRVSKKGLEDEKQFNMDEIKRLEAINIVIDTDLAKIAELTSPKTP